VCQSPPEWPLPPRARSPKRHRAGEDSPVMWEDYLVVLHSKRAVTVNKDGKMVVHLVYECDIWHFFGEIMSKGKKNNYIFHNACQDEIVSFYQEKFVTDKKPPVTMCKQNFYNVATFGERHDGVAQMHLFRTKVLL
jgi:hypothetical protein